MDSKHTLNKLLALYTDYSHIHRRTIALDKYDLISRSNPKIEPENELVRESLLEHVGSLPIVATYLYPLLEHRSNIDLGKVLILLAIHDIGETVVGDAHPHPKTEDLIKSEYQQALSLLPGEYHPYLEEFENKITPESKFAKSVDVFVTFLSDLMLPPDFVARRLSAYEFSSKVFFEKRYEIFAWDSSLTELFEEVIRRYQEMGL